MTVKLTSPLNMESAFGNSSANIPLKLSCNHPTGVSHAHAAFLADSLAMVVGLQISGPRAMRPR